MTDTSTSLGRELAEDIGGGSASAGMTAEPATTASAAPTAPATESSSEAADASTEQPAGESSAEATAEENATEGSDDKPKRGRPRKTAAKQKGIELVLTVTGTAEGTDWRAEVAHGTKRVVKALPIPASAVAAAAKDLHPDIAEAIEGVLSAARDQQRSRVEQLQAELEAAQRALADLEE